MKTILYLGLFLSVYRAIAQPIHPQKQASQAFASGTWQVGIDDGYGHGELLGNRNFAQAHAGYYVANRLLIGVAGSWSREWYGDVNWNRYVAGPLVRYQFTSRWISPFLSLSYQVGKSDLKFSNTSDLAHLIAFTPGLSIAPVPKLRVDLSFGLQWINLVHRFVNIGQPEVGINYLFGRGR